MGQLKICNNTGVGLLEVMVAMIVVAIGLMGLAPLLVTSVEGNVIARDTSTAVNLIKQQIEFYTAQDSIPGIPVEFVVKGLRNRFNRSTRIWDNTTDSTLPDGVYCIDVDVTWTDFQNIPHSRNYTTLILKD
ncbi:MAG: hypothetical protein KOO62_05270 [candidate division Zixibacteria bacterium]|nr:hypothetical protein [candidate division Zixibacteria bacterium]